MDDQPHHGETKTLLELLFRLGQAYLASGEQTAEVEFLLRRIAAKQGMRSSRIVAFPTAILIALHDGSGEHVTVSEGPTRTLRLDQIADVYELGSAIERGDITPGAALAQLDTILHKPARFGPVGIVVGHTILSVGLSLLLVPELINLVAAAVLGTLVGGLKVMNRDRPILSAPLSVVSAALVSILVFLAAKFELPVDPRYALVPPLVAFLPGAMLTLGMVELAYGDMVSGSSRLITGFVQLVLLAFGLAIGAALVGYTPDQLVDPAKPPEPMPWAPWLGVFVFGVGAYLHFSAPRNSLWWMLLVLIVAFTAQRFTVGPFGKEISGFFGTLLATPMAYMIQLRFKGPPAMVTFLPSFWLLVPGSLGLVSVTRMLSDRAAGLDGLSSAVFAFASIGLGTLVGVSLYKWLSDRLRWGRQQIDRVGSYLRGEE